MKKKILMSVMAIVAVTSSLYATQGGGVVAANTTNIVQGDASGSVLSAVFAAVEPTAVAQEPGGAGNRMWFWLEVDLLGLGAGAEIALSNTEAGLFTLGLNGFFNFNYIFASLFADVTDPRFAGGTAFLRFFPGRSAFYLEAGFGFGSWSESLRRVHWDYWGWPYTRHETWTANFFMFAPAIGMRFGGETLFANPFLSLPFIIGTDLTVPVLPRVGIAIGVGL